MLRVAANLSKNRIEYNRLRSTDELEESLIAEDREDLSFVWEAVRDLPDKFREVIHLYYYEGYKTAQIARILRRKEATARSDLRRGRPSAHRALEQAVHSGAIGRGLGLMLGDILATACIEITRRSASRLPNTDALNEAFLTMQREVEIGQVLDLAVEMTPLSNPEALANASLNVFRWKTASYTTIAPLLLALLAAGESPDQARHCALAVGRPLGLAFQLADDLLDVVGSSRNTGKPVGGDIREGKRTVLLADALSAADTADKADLIAIFEEDCRNDNQVARTIELFTSTGALDRSRERIAALWGESRKAIAGLELNSEAQRRLTEACARFVPESLR